MLKFIGPRIASFSCVCIMCFAFSGCKSPDKGHDGHETGKDSGGHDAHGEEEIAITISENAQRQAGIRLEEIAEMPLARSVELPGEIGTNQEREVHVTPRYAGIVRETGKQVGDFVEKGAVLAIIESNESLTSYAIHAPMAGRIIDKHTASGEYVGPERELFTIADLSAVWVNCEAFAGDLPGIKIGASMLVCAVGSFDSVRTTVSYIAPVISTTTRTAVVRAVIPGGSVWRPGLFVKGIVRIPSSAPVPCVRREAVQVLSGKEVIFVPGNDAPGEFEAVAVTTGQDNGSVVELLAGPPAGTKYVASGAFEIKAKIVTSALGGHAGHGH